MLAICIVLQLQQNLLLLVRKAEVPELHNQNPPAGPCKIIRINYAHESNGTFPIDNQKVLEHGIGKLIITLENQTVF